MIEYKGKILKEHSDYGIFYWCVKTSLDEDEGIYVFADAVRIVDGILEFVHQPPDGPERITLAFARGHWKAFYACGDGDPTALAVQYWDGVDTDFLEDEDEEHEAAA